MEKTQSTILNLWLVNELEKEDNKKVRALFNGHWSNQPNVNPAIPTGISTPKKWANTSLERNIREFLKHNDLPNSRNPLNDHSRFEDFPVIAEGWLLPTKKLEVNKRLSRYDDNMVHFAKFRLILGAVGFDKENPICLDRNGNILDGVYRMWVTADLNEKASFLEFNKVYVRQYNFE